MKIMGRSHMIFVYVEFVCDVGLFTIFGREVGDGK